MLDADFHHIVAHFIHAFFGTYHGEHTQGVVAIDHPEIGTAQFVVVTRVTGGPVKLFGVNFNNGRFFRGIVGNLVPGFNTQDNDYGQYDGGNNGPDQLQLVVVR